MASAANGNDKEGNFERLVYKGDIEGLCGRKSDAKVDKLEAMLLGFDHKQYQLSQMCNPCKSIILKPIVNCFFIFSSQAFGSSSTNHTNIA